MRFIVCTTRCGIGRKEMHRICAASSKERSSRSSAALATARRRRLRTGSSGGICRSGRPSSFATRCAFTRPSVANGGCRCSILSSWTSGLASVEQRVGRKLYYDFVRERQQLPVTSANEDRGAMTKLLIDVVDAAGLRPLAQRVQRRVRRWRWRHEYERSLLGWFAVVDPTFFRQTYTGKELAHSYVALAYQQAVFGTDDNRPHAMVISGLSASCADHHLV